MFDANMYCERCSTFVAFYHLPRCVCSYPYNYIVPLRLFLSNIISWLTIGICQTKGLVKVYVVPPAAFLRVREHEWYCRVLVQGLNFKARLLSGFPLPVDVLPFACLVFFGLALF